MYVHVAYCIKLETGRGGGGGVLQIDRIVKGCRLNGLFSCKFLYLFGYRFHAQHFISGIVDLTIQPEDMIIKSNSSPSL